MTKHELDKLSEKYLENNCSPEELQIIRGWANIQAAQNNQDIFVSELEENAVENRIWNKISENIKPKEIEEKIEEEDQKKSFNFNKLWWVAAASITLVLGLQFWPKPAKIEILETQNLGIESKNTANSQQKITLDDGSTVLLQKDASLIVDEHYGKSTRMVFLTGEAFFEITPNAKVPFLVKSENLVTEVLGTSFWIKPNTKDKKIEVSVKTGRVSVYATEAKFAKKLNGVIITPNQKVTFNTESKTLQLGIVDKPVVVKADFTELDFQFDDTNFEEIMETIKVAYGVDIVISNPKLSNCAFTGDLNKLNMYQQLELVCGSINANFELRGSTVFIHGNGCK